MQLIFFFLPEREINVPCHSPAPPPSKPLSSCENLARFVLYLGRFAFSLCNVIYLARAEMD